ncbi:hypothetical protein FRUB_03380 [Fimbriiglobus ruber]|uniref:Uncharacterized protein n=1 Tax=Fimbriiglobus ruber TaxID=1908690 RepID=A0A225DR58_9BACT|nr:hypothetical protein FRUB_03380 [Fimbriiglobus ruber]
MATVTAPAVTAAGTDPADLFPADTLVYAEIGRPGDTIDALAALAKGTSLADTLKSTHDKLDKLKNPAIIEDVRAAGMVPLLIAPEFAAELRRVRAVAVGVTGLSDQLEPRGAAVFLLGDSNAAGFAARAFLTGGSVRRVGVVNEVPIYQLRETVFPNLMVQDGKPAQAEAPLPAPKPNTGEPTFAYVPGLFVVGSDKTAMGDVLKRYAEGAPTKTLARAEGFRRHQETRDRPGLFYYAVPQSLIARVDAANKATHRDVEDDLYAGFKFLTNPKAIRTVAGSIAVGPETVAVSVAADFNPTVTSPLAGVLTGGAVPKEYLPSAAGKALWAFSVALPPAKDRAKALVALADALAVTDGELGMSVVAKARSAERGVGPDVFDELLAGVTAVSLFAPTKMVLPPKIAPLPMLVLHAETSESAALWEKHAGRLLGALSREERVPAAPSSELVDGVTVLTIIGPGLPGNGPIHYARSGTTIAFGQDRKLVAAACKGQAPTGPRATGGPLAIGSFDIARWMEPLIPPPPKVANDVKPPAVPPPPPPPQGPFAPPPISDELNTVQMPSEALFIGLARAARLLPPATVTVTRTNDVVRAKFRIPATGKPVAAAIERFLDWWIEARANANNPPGVPRSIHTE